MARFRYKHIQSTVEDKMPSNLLDGELAVNRFKGKEKIFLKNASGDVVSFSSDSLINKELENKANVSDFSAHTANTEIHVTAADKTTWNAKVDASAIANFFDDAKYEDSGTTKVINFYHGNTIKATIDASDFIVDGMVDDVRIENGYLVIDFNTASGKQDISIPLTDIFDPSNYYDKDDIDDLVGSGFTSSSITDVIIENEEIVSEALTDLDERKLDASAYTPSVELWVSGTGENAVSLKGGDNTASGTLAVAEGSGTTAGGYASHAEGTGFMGQFTMAIGPASHAEGVATSAITDAAHSEGFATSAIGVASHAEGIVATASGYCSHAEGENTIASGEASHAEGENTIASGEASHAEGQGTTTSNASEHASGQYNVSNSATTEFGDSGNTLFSVGNGISEDVRRNAFEIRQNGDIYIVSGNTDIKLQDYIGSVETVTAITPSNSGSTDPIATRVVAENERVTANALTDLDERKLDASAYTPTDLSNYYTKSETSGATEISNALQGKSNANHNQAANTITAMTGYAIASASGAVATNDTLNAAVGKLEKRIALLEAALDGMVLKKITQAEYDALTTKDPNTLYIIRD